jgi:hypothetical protein
MRPLERLIALVVLVAAEFGDACTAEDCQTFSTMSKLFDAGQTKASIAGLPHLPASSCTTESQCGGYHGLKFYTCIRGVPSDKVGYCNQCVDTPLVYQTGVRQGLPLSTEDQADWRAKELLDCGTRHVCRGGMCVAPNFATSQCADYKYECCCPDHPLSKDQCQKNNCESYTDRPLPQYCDCATSTSACGKCMGSCPYGTHIEPLFGGQMCYPGLSAASVSAPARLVVGAVVAGVTMLVQCAWGH